MKLPVLLLLVTMLSGCANQLTKGGADAIPPASTDNSTVESDKAPNEEDFQVTVKTMDDTWKTNEDIVFTAELTNKSKHSVKILHASPLIHVQIYDERIQPLIKTFVTNDIGIIRTIKPKEIYTYEGRKTIRIEKPGKYRLIGTASFSIEPSYGKRKEFKISSEPLEIMVK